MDTNPSFDPTLYGDRIASIYDDEYAPPDPSQVVRCLHQLARGGGVGGLGVGRWRVALPPHAQAEPIVGVGV